MGFARNKWGDSANQSIKRSNFGTKNKACDLARPRAPDAFFTSHDANQLHQMAASCASCPKLSGGMRFMVGGAVWAPKSCHEGSGRVASPGGGRPQRQPTKEAEKRVAASQPTKGSSRALGGWEPVDGGPKRRDHRPQLNGPIHIGTTTSFSHHRSWLIVTYNVVFLDMKLAEY
jgi:hypothetical protein